MTDSKNLAIENAIAMLDLRGLRCPIPAIRVRKYIQQNSANKRLVILLTDRSALQDIPAALVDCAWSIEKIEEATTTAAPIWRLYLAAPHGGSQPARK